MKNVKTKKHAYRRNPYLNKKGTYQYMKRVKKIVQYYCEATKKWLGDNITVVVMDTGMAMHPELKERAILFRDFVNGRPDFYDDNGHGTHVCGAIAGKTIGLAPKCNLIVLKVLDEMGNGDVTYSMRGFRWILENQEKYNIRIVNISMGMKTGTNQVGEQRIMRGVEVLWGMGLIVVAAAGNLGPEEGSITIPGRSKYAITVGSLDIVRSGRGSYKNHIYKPELVVPGANILSCNVDYQEGPMYVKKSGTSMSAPIVSGAAALLLSKETNLTNEEVKRRLQVACNDLRLSKTRQGSGLLSVRKLMNQKN